MIAIWQLIPVFIKIGATTFGAGANEVMIREIVENRQWMSLEEFSESMSFTTLAPGPFHTNLVIAAGYRLSGFTGSIVAVLCFILPGFIVALLVAYGLESRAVGEFLKSHPGMVKGVLAAVTGLIMSAVLKLGHRAAKNKFDLVLIILFTLGISFGKIPFALAAGACGLIVVMHYFISMQFKRS